MARLTLRARYVFPVAGEPIRNGCVTVDGPRITTVGSAGSGSEEIDLGNVAILPGLVNAHVHLDFSDLTSPLGCRGIGFVDWIRTVRAHRQSGGFDHAVAAGLQESLREGVTTVGDIAQTAELPESVAAVPCRVVWFRELIAPTPERVPLALDVVRSLLSPFGRGDGGEGKCADTIEGRDVDWKDALTLTLSQRERGPADGLSQRERGPILAISPHATYSVHPELLSALITLSINKKIPLAMHVAESREEIELLREGSGPMREFLEEIGAWPTMAIERGTRPMNYLKQLALAHRALVVHGNYLDAEEIAFLGSEADRMAAVYCPRTHDWFARDAYPLSEMLRSGVVVALGTDGRGSSPDLSVLNEMRFAARRHRDVGPEQILRMGTLHGAKALGFDREIGTIEPGKIADLTIVALPGGEADPYALLLESEQPVVGRYYRGEATFLRPDLPNRRPSSSSTSTSETSQ